MSKLKAIDPQTVKPSKAKIVVFGPPGVGKTWTSLDFPDVYYIDHEDGATRPQYTEKLKKSNGVYLGTKDGSLDFDFVINQFQALATEKHRFKTVISDSFSKLYNTAAADAAEQFVKEDGKGTGDEFGRDKKQANKPTRRLLNWISKLDMNVILICHESPAWVDGEQVGFKPDCWDKVTYDLDLTLHIQKRGDSRIAIVKKSRLKGFVDGSSFPWNYEEFASRYGRDYLEAETTTITLANEEEVLELKRLLDVVKVSDEDIRKGFTKAGVEKWEEMTTEQIQVWIKFLKGKINK